MNPTNTFKERLFQALLFELLALLICAPAIAWMLDAELLNTGALTLMVSLLAMAWNIAFNLGFDRLQRRLGFRRTLRIRAAHALAFEAGLLAAVVPLAAWWLKIGLLDAFLLDLGLVLFFLPYTFAFNWVYDTLRERNARRPTPAPPSSAWAPAAKTVTGSPRP